MATWGARGDEIAPLTSLLTALTLVAAVISVRFQSAELQMQRQEMADARVVQKRQEKAQNRLAQAQERANTIAEEAIKAQERLAQAQEQANTLAEEAVRTQVRLSHPQDETRSRPADAQQKANVLADLARQVQGRMAVAQLSERASDDVAPDPLKSVPHGGVAQVPIARQLIRRTAHVCRALNVILAPQRVDAHALAPDGCHEQREITEQLTPSLPW
jgi:hypothetical protein